MPSTAAAIRDRITALISAILPTADERTPFRAHRNEGRADFTAWAEANAAGAHRRFQVRDDGLEEPPEVTNTDVDMRHVTFVVRIAYPQTGRWGKDGALDRDDVIAQDWRKINRSIGIYGRANFTGSYDCTPLGADREMELGDAVDFLIVRARFSFYYSVYTAPVAGFTYSVSDYDAAFTDTSTDADGSTVSWSWNFGDSETSTARNPSHTYASAGTYTVTLTVTDDQGVQSTALQSVEVVGVVDGVDLFFGESNMNGYGDTDNADSGLSIATNYSSVDFAGKSASGTLDPMVWTDTALGDLRPRGAGGAPNMGPELSFGRYMDLYGGDAGTTRIAKVGVNGSPLAGTQGWLPSATFPVTGGNIYTQAVAFAQSVIAATGKPARSIVWTQGVNDGDTAPHASAYAANLATFMAAIRSVFGPIPLIFNKAHVDTDAATCPQLATVRAQQVAYAASDSNSVLVSADHIPLGTDNIHWDANGQISLGNALGKALADKLRPTRTDNQGSGAVPWVQAIHEPGIFSLGAPKPRAPDSRAGDLQILIITANDDATAAPAPSTLNGFVSLGSTQLTSTFAGISINVRLYTRAVTQVDLDANGGRLPDAVLSDNNDENVGRIITLRGPSPLTAANIELVKTQVNNSADTSFTVAGDNTLGANRLLLAIEASFAGGFPVSIGSWACTGATGVAEVQDSLYVSTNKTHIGIAKATVAAAGAFGPFTATFTASYAVWAGVVLVVKP